MRITVETDGSGFRVHAGDGSGWFWTTNPALVVDVVQTRLERFVDAMTALARDGCARHVKVLAGTCPTCGLPASDCVGEELEP